MSEVPCVEPQIARRAPHSQPGGVTFGRSNRGRTGQSAAARQIAHFGWVFGSEKIIAIALDTPASGDGGMRRVAAFVRDRDGNPDRMGIWFNGSIRGGMPTKLTSADGKSALIIDSVGREIITGSFTDARSTAKPFMAMRAAAGAGIYDVTFTRHRQYRATASRFVVLDLGMIGDDGVTGSLIAADGEATEFTIRVAVRVTEAELSRRELPAKFRDQRIVCSTAERFTAVVSASGAFWLGCD